MTWTRGAKKFIFDRYFSWCLDDLADTQVIQLEYPVDFKPRFGYGKPPHPQLNAIFEAARSNFSSWIAHIGQYSSALFGIAQQKKPAASEPTFENRLFLGLDAAVRHCRYEQAAYPD
jgi:hypothetical protein